MKGRLALDYRRVPNLQCGVAELLPTSISPTPPRRGPESPTVLRMYIRVTSYRYLGIQLEMTCGDFCTLSFYRLNRASHPARAPPAYASPHHVISRSAHLPSAAPTMAFRASLGRALLNRTAARSFHSTPRACVKVGDEVPSFDGLFEKSPGNKVNLAKELQNANGYIVGVPGAFTGTCSSQHVPSYMNHPKLNKAGQVFVVSVNDPFV